MSNLSITNGGTSESGGVLLASPAPSKTTTLVIKGPLSVTSGTIKFAKVRSGPRKVCMDAAAREREREAQLDDERKAESSEESDSD